MRKSFSILFLIASTAVHGQMLSTSAPKAANSAVAFVSSGFSSSAFLTASSVTPRAAMQAASMSARSSGGRFFGGFLEKPGKSSPIGSLAATFTYAKSGEIGGSDRSLLGWTVTPEVNFTKHLALQADFTSLYVRSINPGQTRLAIAAGPRYYFAAGPRITPFLFAEGGEIRRSTSGSVVKNWNPIAKSGFGIDYQIVRGLGLQLIPGEYIGQRNDDGTWLHSFSARGGIVFSFYR